jgi:hypothetical protein
MRSRVLPIVLFLLVAGLFLIAHRGAYQSYFTDDEIDNLTLTRNMVNSDFILALLSPRFYPSNFRPAGHLFFRMMGDSVGLNFPPYVAFLHILHLFNVAILWLILRRLSIPFWASAAGALFFAFHMAVFDVYWKPMYVFDLLCGTFCLLAVLFWLEDRWIVSLVSFWLAYRSKEMAVMLPIALAGYEVLMGKRRWLRLTPFFAISLWFGINGLMATTSHEGYWFHYNLPDIWKSVMFYSSRLAVLPYDGLIFLPFLLLLPLLCPPLVRDRTVWFGAIAFFVLLTPMLLLTDRLFAAYLYVPLIGLSIVIAAAAARQPIAAVAVAFALWIPWNYANLRWLRREALSQADDRRAYVDGITGLARTHPEITTFLYRIGPLTDWGARSAAAWFHPAATIKLAYEGNPDAAAVLQSPALAVLEWNKIKHRMEPLVRTPDTRDVSYMEVSSHMPVWQLGEGWVSNEGAFRWTHPHATARLYRPPGTTGFEMIVNVSPEYIGKVHSSHVALSLNGQPIGSADFNRSGWQTAHWKLENAPAGPAELSVNTSPAYPGGEPLGIPICAFGFLPKPGGPKE